MADASIRLTIWLCTLHPAQSSSQIRYTAIAKTFVRRLSCVLEQGMTALAKPLLQLPCAVYRFDPDTGHIKIVEEMIAQPCGAVSPLRRKANRFCSNGIVFSPNGDVCYVTDTSAANARDPLDNTKGAAM